MALSGKWKKPDRRSQRFDGEGFRIKVDYIMLSNMYHSLDEIFSAEVFA